MHDMFDAKLQASFEAANAHRSGIEAFKKLAKRDPTVAAARVSKGFPWLCSASVLRRASCTVWTWCQTKLDAYAADGSLSDEERAAKVCEVGVEALRGLEAVLLHNLQEESYRTSGE